MSVPRRATQSWFQRARHRLASGEEGPPRRDRQGVGHHGGAYAAGLIAGAAAEPAEGAGDDHPLPVREVAEPQVHPAEEDGGENERRRAAPGPVFYPLLEDAAEEELLGQSQTEEKADEVGGQFQRIRGGDQVSDA